MMSFELFVILFLLINFLLDNDIFLLLHISSHDNMTCGMSKRKMGLKFLYLYLQLSKCTKNSFLSLHTCWGAALWFQHDLNWTFLKKKFLTAILGSQQNWEEGTEIFHISLTSTQCINSVIINSYQQSGIFVTTDKITLTYPSHPKPYFTYLTSIVYLRVLGVVQSMVLDKAYNDLNPSWQYQTEYFHWRTNLPPPNTFSLECIHHWFQMGLWRL